MINILQLIPKTAKKSPAGWYSFNAPCCTHRGETKDKRHRGGIKVDGGDWAYHCFNCNFNARYTVGRVLSKGASDLLKWMGVDDDTISKINLDSIRNRSLEDIVRHKHEIKAIKQFKEHTLPPGARPITLTDEKFINFLAKRGLTPQDYSFRITPNATGRDANRIIIPYYYAKKIVGWTSRYLIGGKLKYKNENQQPGYVFGLEMQDPGWLYAIVAEGCFDAISINGLAILHNEFSDTQLMMLNQLGKEIIVVPDQDKAGMVLAYEAIEAGFSVSIPDWGKNDNNEYINDINEAVQKYGKIGTLLSIIHAKESNKIKITMALNTTKRRLGITC